MKPDAAVGNVEDDGTAVGLDMDVREVSEFQAGLLAAFRHYHRRSVVERIHANISSHAVFTNQWYG